MLSVQEKHARRLEVRYVKTHLSLKMCFFTYLNSVSEVAICNPNARFAFVNRAFENKLSADVLFQISLRMNTGR